MDFEGQETRLMALMLFPALLLQSCRTGVLCSDLKCFHKAMSEGFVDLTDNWVLYFSTATNVFDITKHVIWQ